MGVFGNLSSITSGLPSLDSLLGNSPSTETKKSVDLKSPWGKAKEGFFPSLEIKDKRWNQLFPYRLMVVNENGAPVGTLAGPEEEGGSNLGATTAFGATLGQTVITIWEPVQANAWVFNLPISPQQLNIVDQFAINTSATLGGILEEHNGVKFKMITASGTLGVWPYRPSVEKPPEPVGVIASFIGGTLSSFESLGSQLNKIKTTAESAISGGHPAAGDVKELSKRLQPKDSKEGKTSTGYYQALYLQQFLERYAEAKKKKANKGWRLVFDIPKQNQSFVVTPTQFTWQQSVNKPTEITFNLQFKAWRRIDLKLRKRAEGDDNTAIPPFSAGFLQNALNTVMEARKGLAAVNNLIGAVRSDVSAPAEVLRQTALYLKDSIGVLITMVDLPKQIASDYSAALATYGEIIPEIKRLGASLGIGIGPEFDSRSNSASAPTVSPSPAASGGPSPAASGGPSPAASGGPSPAASSQGDTSGQAGLLSNIATDPKRFDLMNSVPIDSLQLSAAQRAKIDQEIDKVRALTADDLKKFRATIQDFSLQLANSFGAGSTYYNQVYGRGTPNSRITPMSLDEFEILRKLYDCLNVYDQLTATTQFDDAKRKTNMEYVAGLADLSGIEFNQSQSKILVPVPFGATIEEIAARYLKNPQRWLEIATLNNLRAPYIDENGFQIPLLSNATGRQLTVGSNQNLYVGQRILVQGANQVPSARVILSIDRLSDTSYLLTLDGQPNLDNFTLSAKSYIQAYLPGTVNSQQKIFIPSDKPSDSGPQIIAPASTLGDPLTGLSKVDWLLTDKGDLAVNSFGDFRLSAGMTNLLQALKIKFGTQKGKFLLHPDFGLEIAPGTINSDVNAQDLFNSIKSMIQKDQRFDGVSYIQISFDGPTAEISVGAVPAGQTGVFPVTFQVRA